jgi:hypothetical protein
MKNQKIQIVITLAIWLLATIYFVDCLFTTLENLELIGASMLAFKPSFSVSPLSSGKVTRDVCSVVYTPQPTEFLTMSLKPCWMLTWLLVRYCRG